MQDAIAALEAALTELEHARAEMPEDLRSELDGIIEQTRSVLRSLAGATEDADPAGAPG